MTLSLSMGRTGHHEEHEGHEVWITRRAKNARVTKIVLRTGGSTMLTTLSPSKGVLARAIVRVNLPLIFRLSSAMEKSFCLSILPTNKKPILCEESLSALICG